MYDNCPIPAGCEGVLRGQMGAGEYLRVRGVPAAGVCGLIVARPGGASGTPPRSETMERFGGRWRRREGAARGDPFVGGRAARPRPVLPFPFCVYVGLDLRVIGIPLRCLRESLRVCASVNVIRVDGHASMHECKHARGCTCLNSSTLIPTF